MTNNNRTICIVTGTRAEYGLLFWLMKDIQADPELQLQIIATGMHLSPEFGLTYKVIEEDGFRIDAKVEMLLSSDTPVGIAKSLGLGVIGFADALSRLKPDIIVLLGDRFEALAVAETALVARIPVAHIHGGELTEGVIDEAIRHTITKMAHLHFTATEKYRERVIQLGEPPERVFNFGAIGLDNIKRLKLLDRGSFEESINFTLAKNNLLVTFHPVTLENSTADQQFEELLVALDHLKETNLIFTKPNADTDGRVVIRMIDEYVSRHPEKAVSFTSLGQLRYLSAMQFVDAVVGNSSSGLIEAPSFKIGTINIGDRQRGRIRSVSVIDCQPSTTSISEALNKLCSHEFQKNLQLATNPYEKDAPTNHILNILRSYPLEGILKKNFFDVDTNP